MEIADNTAEDISSELSILLVGCHDHLKQCAIVTTICVVQASCRLKSQPCLP